MPMEGPLQTGCARCRGEQVMIIPGPRMAEASLCECSRVCLKCHNRRYLFRSDALGRETVEVCQCERTRQRIRLFNEAQLPGKFADARLSQSFQDDNNHQAFTTFRLLAQDFQKGQKGILLMGPPGVGKTFLIAGFIYELVFRHGIPALFRDFFHLLADLRSGYAQGRAEADLMDPLIMVEVLVIDELGKGRNSQWEHTILDSIISNRYNSGKTTVFTSNYTPSRHTTLENPVRDKDGFANGEEPLRETLGERVGARIYSRLAEMCDFVSMNGPDRRMVTGLSDVP